MIVLDLDDTVVYRTRGVIDLLMLYANPFALGTVGRAYDGAVSSIRELADRYQIAAITSRSGIAADHTERWLQSHGLGGIPLIHADKPHPSDDTRVDFKAEGIRFLRERGYAPWLGIGDRPSDGHAYRSEGLHSLLVAHHRVSGVAAGGMRGSAMERGLLACRMPQVTAGSGKRDGANGARSAVPQSGAREDEASAAMEMEQHSELLLRITRGLVSSTRALDEFAPAVRGSAHNGRPGFGAASLRASYAGAGPIPSAGAPPPPATIIFTDDVHCFMQAASLFPALRRAPAAGHSAGCSGAHALKADWESFADLHAHERFLRPLALFADAGGTGARAGPPAPALEGPLGWHLQPLPYQDLSAAAAATTREPLWGQLRRFLLEGDAEPVLSSMAAQHDEYRGAVARMATAGARLSAKQSRAVQDRQMQR
jgi:hypothetical protein